jgi:hypothetical protein
MARLAVWRQSARLWVQVRLAGLYFFLLNTSRRLSTLWHPEQIASSEPELLTNAH